MTNPDCHLCFGRGWVNYPRAGGTWLAEACHYCERWSAERASATEDKPTPDVAGATRPNHTIDYQGRQTGTLSSGGPGPAIDPAPPGRVA